MGPKIGDCFDEVLACRDASCSSFALLSRRYVVHELAHAWMDETLDVSAPQRFTVGLMDEWDVNPLQIGYRGPDQLTDG